MPQIYLILGPGIQALCTESEVLDLGKRLIPIVEGVFGIGGTNDTAFTAVKAVETIDEADFQVEVRYTVGTDEYGWGKPFNPPLIQQKKLAVLIATEFRMFLEANGLSDDYTLSVWCKPHRGGFFKMFGKGEVKS